MDPTIKPPAPHGPLPSERQLHWHDMEFYGFVHFTVNTFTGREWGEGDESPAVFNPTALDARQWARTTRDVGMKGLILTAKHHDGFCLWPSRYTQHSVKNSPWKNGQGNVVKELADACREAGIRFGVYLSPWDRNHADYGTLKYLTYYEAQLEELLTHYGPLFMVWFDGANGGSGYYGGARETRRINHKSYYNFPRLWDRVRQLQPDAVLFSDAGPDVRWVGNEQGQAPDTCWARINPEGIYVGEADTKRLGSGDADGTVWRAAEADVSIRKGWFWHANEQPKSLDQLLDIYFNSVGRGTCLNLNIPPDRRGLIPEEDVARLKEMRQVLDLTFKDDLARGKRVSASNMRGNSSRFAASNVTDGNKSTYWAADDNVREAELVIDIGRTVRFDCVRIEEYIPLGQRIAAFAVDARVEGKWQKAAAGTTIGARRILRLPTRSADQVRLRITEAQASPTIAALELYKSPQTG